jgi:hypothetical protein
MEITIAVKRVILEKLLFLQPVKEFSETNVTQRFISPQSPPIMKNINPFHFQYAISL